MNAKRIERVLGTLVLAGAVAMAVALSLRVASDFTAAELAEREAALRSDPTRDEAERQRIVTIARAQGHSEEQARAIAAALMPVRSPSVATANR